MIALALGFLYFLLVACMKKVMVLHLMSNCEQGYDCYVFSCIDSGQLCCFHVHVLVSFAFQLTLYPVHSGSHLHCV